MEEYINLLFNTPLFDNIEKRNLEVLLKCLNPFVKFYKKGNYIILSGEDIKVIGVVLSGKVQMLKEDVWGNKTTLALMSEKSIFGETFVCSKSYNSTVSFQAAADCTVLYLSFDKILHTCSKVCEFHYKLIDNMVILIAQKNIQLLDKLEIISKKTLREKILSYLSIQAQKNGSLHFTLQMNRIELADYLCADRSALSRELSCMKDEGIIDYDKNNFRLYKKLD